MTEESRVSSLNAAERETIVSIDDMDRVARIWTARRKDITRLRKHSGAKEKRSGFHGSTEWAEFEIPADQWNPASGIKRKRRKLSDEEKRAVAERLRKAREVSE